MEPPATFARHFARLISLLLHDAGNVDEQKASLRALVTLSKDAPVSLSTHDWQLLANDAVVPSALSGVGDVTAQMAAHSIARVEVAAGTGAADLLGLARIVAARAAAGDGGAHVSQKVAALGAKTVRITLTPAAVPTDVSKLTHHEILAAVDAAPNVDAVTKLLDDLAQVADQSAKLGKPGIVLDILHGVVLRDARLADGDRKRELVLAIRRMSKPALLRAVTSLITKKPEERQRYFDVLEHTGEEGADALIEQITQANTEMERKAFLGIFRDLSDAVPALTRKLSDSRWFVVRNAVDLLGELGATKAEAELIALLRHPDDRVRRAATNALLRLGTPGAMKAIYAAITDTSPAVRIQATEAISTRKDARSSTTLIRAIEDETDAEVQTAMITALGKIATPAAVQKLVRMAEPQGRLFKKKTSGLRVAAVRALALARTPTALRALEELKTDKEREVRETAARALAVTAP